MATAGQLKREIGDVKRETSVRIPGDFSGAITLVATLTVTAVIPQEPGFTPSGGRRNPPTVAWRLRDSIDGEHWYGVEDTTGAFQNVFGSGNLHQTRRFVVPFGPQLAVDVWATDDDVPWTAIDDGEIDNVVLRLFWRGTAPVGDEPALESG